MWNAVTEGVTNLGRKRKKRAREVFLEERHVKWILKDRWELLRQRLEGSTSTQRE